MPSMVSNEATKPPTLTMPLACPSRDTGANVRATSKPIIDPGPPRPVVTTSVQSSHIGASPGHNRVTVQAVIIDATMPRTIDDRRHGGLAMEPPISGPATMKTPTSSVSRPAASASERCSACTKNGNPHSSPITFAANCKVKCDHSPSRVPGSCHASRRSRPTVRTSLTDRADGTPGGTSRTTRTVSSPSSTPTEALATNVVVQPYDASDRDNGIAATSAPHWPIIAVNAVSNGLRDDGNQEAMIRSTLMNTMASPMPTKTRATSAPAYVPVKAKPSCAAVMKTVPATSSRWGP